MSTEKCWWFFRYRGEWVSEDDLEELHGFNGLEDVEESVRICIYTEKVMTWKDAWELLKKLIKAKEEVIK